MYIAINTGTPSVPPIPATTIAEAPPPQKPMPPFPTPMWPMQHDVSGQAANVPIPEQSRRAVNALRTISEGTAATTGGDFFRSLVRQLAEAFEVNMAFVTECVPGKAAYVRSIAAIKRGEYRESFTYDVEGTPCAGVIDGAVCYYPTCVADLFPKEAGQESYLGAPILNSKGKVIGHLALLDEKPMTRTADDFVVFNIFAARAGAELERKRAQDALRESEQKLRQLNTRLEEYNRNLERTIAARIQESEKRRQVAESLREMLAILNSERRLEEILAYIAQEASRLLGAPSCAIFRLQHEQDRLTLQASYGLPATDDATLTFPLRQSFLGQAVLSRQPVAVADLHTALAENALGLPAPNRRFLQTNFRTLLAIPLMRQVTTPPSMAAAGHDQNGVGRDVAANEVYGGISLYYDTPHTFSDEEIKLALAFSHQGALAIANARLREEARQAAVLGERSRLARELHDSVTQALYSTTLFAEAGRELAENGDLSQATHLLQRVGETSQQALKEVRLLVYELRPVVLEKQGLVGALQQRLDAVEKRAGVEATLVVNDPQGLGVLSATVEETLYRIAQEALNNALKHANATAVTIALSTGPTGITLQIHDDGVGFDPAVAAASGGLGLTSMRERIQQHHGAFTVHSTADGGTTIHVTIAQ